jgi:hypothetical protein
MLLLNRRVARAKNNATAAQPAPAGTPGTTSTGS